MEKKLGEAVAERQTWPGNTEEKVAAEFPLANLK